MAGTVGKSGGKKSVHETAQFAAEQAGKLGAKEKLPKAKRTKLAKAMNEAFGEEHAKGIEHGKRAAQNLERIAKSNTQPAGPSVDKVGTGNTKSIKDLARRSSPTRLESAIMSRSGLSATLENGQVVVSGKPAPGSYAARLQKEANAPDVKHTAPLSEGRVRAFRERVLPILSHSAAEIFNGGPKLARQMESIVGRVADNVATKGAKDGKPDTDYPPRAAQETYLEFGKALGLPSTAMEAAARRCAKLSEIAHKEGRYGPLLEQLSPADRQFVTRATEFIRVGQPAYGKLSLEERAFVATMVLNNLTWHVTNFQRGGEGAQPNRVLPTAREGVFNTYRDNLNIRHRAGGETEATYMLLMDAYNFGKLLPKETLYERLVLAEEEGVSLSRQADMADAEIVKSAIRGIR